jgi:hypothetical protein
MVLGQVSCILCLCCDTKKPVCASDVTEIRFCLRFNAAGTHHPNERRRTNSREQRIFKVAPAPLIRTQDFSTPRNPDPRARFVERSLLSSLANRLRSGRVVRPEVLRAQVSARHAGTEQARLLARHGCAAVGGRAAFDSAGAAGA